MWDCCLDPLPLHLRIPALYIHFVHVQTVLGGEVNQTNAETFLPLKPAVLHLLLALSHGEAHGYGLMRRIREDSGGHVDLKTGPFYRHLKRLLDIGAVTEVQRPDGVDVRRGAHFALTPLGRQMLAAERRRLAELLGLSAKARTT